MALALAALAEVLRRAFFGSDPAPPLMVLANLEVIGTTIAAVVLRGALRILRL